MEFNVTITNRTLNLNQRQLDDFLNGPRGPVGRQLNKVGLKIVAGAKIQVGVDTGRLRNSINMVHRRDGRGQYIEVGSDLSYALLHHNGSRPHDIRSRPGDTLLRFSNGGRTIYSRQVAHPGTRPNRFLSDQLRLVIS